MVEIYVVMVEDKPWLGMREYSSERIRAFKDQASANKSLAQGRFRAGWTRDNPPTHVQKFIPVELEQQELDFKEETT